MCVCGWVVGRGGGGLSKTDSDKEDVTKGHKGGVRTQTLQQEQGAEEDLSAPRVVWGDVEGASL